MSDTNSPIVALYRARTPGSAARHARARELFPSGITHDARHLLPHPIYVQDAEGGRKRDVDGNVYVDYQGGHGALLLGHRHPAVMAAVAEQLGKGTHYGAGHDLEMRWAELVRELVPSAERVRFTSSGTEATMLAVRLARAATGRRKLLRFRGHFHGWNDHMAFGYANHYDGSPSAGVVPAVAEEVLLADPGDLVGTGALLEQHDDIAAVILEPTGSTFGQVPIAPSFLRLLRALTRARGVVLIFDEVVTGFRVAPGGAQAALGVVPDLTTLAKILAGGLPGGAVAGREDLLDHLDFEAAPARGGEKILHPGTYNASLLSAAAGCATLELIRDGEACARAAAGAAELRLALNRLFAEEDVPWAAYGEHSGFHVFTNPEGLDIDPMEFDPSAYDYRAFKGGKGSGVVSRLRLALRVHGVDISGWPGGPVAAVHDADDLERTVAGFRASIRMLRAEGEIKAPRAPRSPPAAGRRTSP